MGCLDCTSSREYSKFETSNILSWHMDIYVVKFLVGVWHEDSDQRLFFSVYTDAWSVSLRPGSWYLQYARWKHWKETHTHTELATKICHSWNWSKYPLVKVKPRYPLIEVCKYSWNWRISHEIRMNFWNWLSEWGWSWARKSNTQKPQSTEGTHVSLVEWQHRRSADPQSYLHQVQAR